MRALRRMGVYGCLQIPRRHADFWRIVAYCYCPTRKKPMHELDEAALTSSVAAVLIVSALE
jgi:hypothetical protein